jgi:hypothetical protein
LLGKIATASTMLEKGSQPKQTHETKPCQTEDGRVYRVGFNDPIRDDSFGDWISSASIGTEKLEVGPNRLQ